MEAKDDKIEALADPKEAPLDLAFLTSMPRPPSKRTGSAVPHRDHAAERSDAGQRGGLQRRQGAEDALPLDLETWRRSWSLLRDGLVH